MNRNLKVVLFGNTGAGNALLRGLLELEFVEIQGVVTRQYPAPYPYFSETQLEHECENLGLTCFPDLDLGSDQAFATLSAASPDLILVANFDQIVERKIIELPSLGVVNFHPSLLPSYRGHSPIRWALLNDETKTGVTAHYLIEEIDAGDILLQQEIEITEGDNLCSLTEKLCNTCFSMARPVLSLFQNFERPCGNAQQPELASFAPPPSREIGFLERCESLRDIQRKLRALSPFPGTSILYQGQRLPVARGTALTTPGEDGLRLVSNGIELYKNGEGILLQIDE